MKKIKMKKSLILITILFLSGCNSQTKIQKTTQGESPILNKQAKLEKVETVGLNEVCGGSAEIMCKANLICKITTQSLNATGTCIEAVTEKELACSKTKDPVCGLKNEAKNGYLNECEAIRHGATIVNKGFCKIDKTVKNNCDAKFTAIGNCKMNLTGFEFVKEKNACTKKFASGCEAEIPFGTLEDCQAKCLK